MMLRDHNHLKAIPSCWSLTGAASPLSSAARSGPADAKSTACRLIERRYVAIGTIQIAARAELPSSAWSIPKPQSP